MHALGSHVLGCLSPLPHLTSSPPLCACIVTIIITIIIITTVICQVAHQASAVLGLALVAMAEPLGASMAGRMLEHLLQYGDAPARRGVPLALAALHVSNPGQQVVDSLSRLIHAADTEVCCAYVAHIFTHMLHLSLIPILRCRRI